MKPSATHHRGASSGRRRHSWRQSQRTAWRAQSHRERRLQRGQVLEGAENRRSTPAALRKLRRLRFAGCGLCGIAAGLLAGPSSLLVGVAWWKGEAPRIESVSVSGLGRLAAQDVALATGVARGSFVRDVDAGAVGERLTSHPWIRAARAAALPSGELLVEIEERKARAVLRSDSEPEWRLVDETGVPYAVAEPELAATLPKLRSRLELTADLRHEALTRALAIVNGLPAGLLRAFSPAEATPSEVAAGWPQGLELHLPAPDSHEGWILRARHPHLEVILGQEEGMELRLERLERLLRSNLREVREADSIDLRFADSAVLRAAPASRRGGHQAVAEHGGTRPSKPGQAGEPPLRSLGGEKHGTKR